MRRTNQIFQPEGRQCAVSIGVFDGIHLGHQGVLHELVSRARKENLHPLVLTFSTHPDQLISNRTPETLITTEHRLRLIEELGVETTVILPFDDNLRKMTASRFANEVLGEQLKTALLLMGYDSALGQDREGDFKVMQKLGQEAGFQTATSPPLLWQGNPISSSHIRAVLELGDMAQVRGLLGRPFSFLGKVIKGKGRGRQLGFATANMDPTGCLMPPTGVYAASAIHCGKNWPAILNLGYSPTFAGKQKLIETHLLDFPDQDLHGEEVEVAFYCRIRDERQFASPEELIHQVKLDLAQCRKIMGNSSLSDY